MFDLPLGNDSKPQCTQETFETVSISPTKTQTYTMKDQQDDAIHGKFYQKELIEVT